MKIQRPDMSLLVGGAATRSAASIAGAPPTEKSASVAPPPAQCVAAKPSVGQSCELAARPAVSTPPARPLANPNGPTIGVLPGAFLYQAAEKIGTAGGRVVIIDPRAGHPVEQMRGVDGLVICGGRDVDPQFYHEPNTKSQGISPHGTREDAFMLACIQTGYALGTPMLGICRGHQLMNVADGGSLYQDFRSDRPETAGHAPPHEVTIASDSTLARVIGATSWVTNSIHHQSVKAPGEHMRVVAQTADGVVEGIQKVDNAAQIGVQFHPEIMDSTESSKLFRFIIESAAGFRSARVTTTAA